MIKIYCDGCEALISEIKTFDWKEARVCYGWALELNRIDQDELAFWCPDCKEKKDRVFLIMKANKVSAIEQVVIEGKALLKSEMGKND